MESLLSRRITMERKPVVTLCILTVCLSVVSCTKLKPTSAPQSGPLTFESTKLSNAIPDDYGALIGVTQNAGDPAWTTLWFQKPDKTISAIFVNTNEGRIYEKSLTIPRK